MPQVDIGSTAAPSGAPDGPLMGRIELSGDMVNLLTA